MKIKPVNIENTNVLESFLSTCGDSLISFRYFKSRSLQIIENHIVTLLGFNGDGQPVAYGHLDPEEGKIWLGICVSEGSMGIGYGTLMMNALFIEAANHKIEKIYLSVDKTNFAAIRLYEKFGFELEKETDSIQFYFWAQSSKNTD